MRAWLLTFNLLILDKLILLNKCTYNYKYKLIIEYSIVYDEIHFLLNNNNNSHTRLGSAVKNCINKITILNRHLL